ncbi:MAG TPA: hypothetical protein VGD67_25300, partial [Pseudonocardiaceae bacterium]
LPPGLLPPGHGHQPGQGHPGAPQYPPHEQHQYARHDHGQDGRSPFAPPPGQDGRSSFAPAPTPVGATEPVAVGHQDGARRDGAEQNGPEQNGAGQGGAEQGQSWPNADQDLAHRATQAVPAAVGAAPGSVPVGPGGPRTGADRDGRQWPAGDHDDVTVDADATMKASLLTEFMPRRESTVLPEPPLPGLDPPPGEAR